MGCRKCFPLGDFDRLPLRIFRGIDRRSLEEHHIGPGWAFLTGAPEDIDAIRFSLGFYDIDPEVDRNLASHTGLVRMGNDNYQRWTMAPALTGTQHILATLNHVDREWDAVS